MTDHAARIRTLLAENDVVLFLKGTRQSPRCGFSSRVVDALDAHLTDYVAIDAMADESLLSAVKKHADWPTLPQLYVKGALVGGADIVEDLVKAGELAGVLGVSAPLEVVTPEITVTEAALAAFRDFSGTDAPSVRLAVGRDFVPELEIEAPRPKDVVLRLGALTLSVDPLSARRADGMRIDFSKGPGATGFKIDNPNAPPKVRSLSVEEYAKWRTDGRPHLLLDVRTPAEVEIAKIEGAQLLDDDMRDDLEELDRTKVLVMQCHHGIRSRAAAEHCISMGFREVYNLEGGIEAWSQRVDPSVPRY